MENQNFKTDQETFWASAFGNEYIGRNQSAQLLASNISFFSKILSSTRNVKTVMEFGANIGMNLKALKTLLPEVNFSALEINESAYAELATNKWINAHLGSILEYKTNEKFDFVFFKGVLIHLNPDMLQSVYEVAYNSSQKYIMFAEYYNPSPVTIPYRGHTDKLFKRDFAGELLIKYKDLKLVDYGF